MEAELQLSFPGKTIHKKHTKRPEGSFSTDAMLMTGGR